MQNFEDLEQSHMLLTLEWSVECENRIRRWNKNGTFDLVSSRSRLTMIHSKLFENQTSCSTLWVTQTNALEERSTRANPHAFQAGRSVQKKGQSLEHFRLNGENFATILNDLARRSIWSDSDPECSPKRSRTFASVFYEVLSKFLVGVFTNSRNAFEVLWRETEISPARELEKRTRRKWKERTQKRELEKTKVNESGTEWGLPKLRLIVDEIRGIRVFE